jgi:hypothetical protein
MYKPVPIVIETDIEEATLQNIPSYTSKECSQFIAIIYLIFSIQAFLTTGSIYLFWHYPAPIYVMILGVALLLCLIFNHWKWRQMKKSILYVVITMLVNIFRVGSITSFGHLPVLISQAITGLVLLEIFITIMCFKTRIATISFNWCIVSIVMWYSVAIAIWGWNWSFIGSVVFIVISIWYMYYEEKNILRYMPSYEKAYFQMYLDALCI